MKSFIFTVLLLLAVLTAGCTPAVPTAASAPPPAETPAAAPTTVALEPGKGGLAGQVREAAVRWSGEEVIVFAAPFTAVNGQDEGFYVLEPEVHPHSTLDAQGNFQISAVDPGKYVLVVGPSARDGKLVMKGGSDKPQVFTVKAGEMLQTGALELAQ
jgi:hypothetical protein